MFYNSCILTNSVKKTERAEYTSAVCDNTAVVSQRNWSLSISRSVHKHCINSYNSNRMIKPFRCRRFRGKVTQCSITTVVSQQNNNPKPQRYRVKLVKVN